MRVSLVCLLMAAAGPAVADWGDYDYEEVRELSVDARGLTSLSVDAGAGSLVLRAVDGGRSVDVTATVLVDGAEDDKARRFIEKRMILSLDRAGDRAELVADFKGGMSPGKNGAVALDIRMPAGIDLVIDDGSGSIDIRDTRALVQINDGSGSISVGNAGDVRIDDGSGSVEVADATGNVRIDDGSGSIKVRRVAGSVVVDDGSGSIDVEDVQGSLTIIDAGSGGIDYRRVSGGIDVPKD